MPPSALTVVIFEQLVEKIGNHSRFRTTVHPGIAPFHQLRQVCMRFCEV